MKCKILVYLDNEQGEAVVCETAGEQAAECRETFGRDWDNWPCDLGLFERAAGMHIWEGMISDAGLTFNGSWRYLTAFELDRIVKNVPVLEVG